MANPRKGHTDYRKSGMFKLQEEIKKGRETTKKNLKDYDKGIIIPEKPSPRSIKELKKGKTIVFT